MRFARPRQRCSHGWSASRPEAAVQGFSVQAMARRPAAYELILGVTTDPVFGPVIAFGEGGTAVEVVRDRALALPPLNAHLARELVMRTRVYERLKGFRHLPPVDLPALDRTLVQLSQLVTDVSEVHELDVNPLWCDERGVLALDARIVVRADGAGPERSRDPALPERARRDLEARLRQGAAASPHPARGRGGTLRDVRELHRGRHPLPLLRIGALFRALGDGALHPDRLRPRDGFHRDDPGRARAHARSGARRLACRRLLRGVRSDRPLRREGPGTRQGACYRR